MSADLLAEFETFYTSGSNTGQQIAHDQQAQALHGTGPPPPPQASTLSFSKTAWEDNPWEEESLRPESWGHQPTRMHGHAHQSRDVSVSLASHAVEDEWGDFETFRNSDATAFQPTASDNEAIWGDLAAFQQGPFSPVIEKSSANSAKHDWTDESEANPSSKTDTQERQQQQDSAVHVERPKLPRDENILFDADEDYDMDTDDDFGDFESGPASTAKPPVPVVEKRELTSSQPPLLDIDFDYQSQTLNPDHSRTKPSQPPDLMDDYVEWEPTPSSFRTATLSPKPSVEYSKSPEPPTSVTSVENDDAWDDFDDGPAVPDIKPTPVSVADESQPDASAEALPIKPKPMLPIQIAPATSATPPPTNIPPPSVLLPLFPLLLSQINTEFLQPLSALNPALRTSTLAHPSTHAALHSHLSIVRTLARLIAGRKLRWKRDTHLAQSTRIGPASSGRTSGMKLSSVDRSEAAREDREVADAVRLWRGLMAGRLRAAAAAAGLASTAMPDVSETMTVRTAKAEEGAIAAAKACALCGLRREERISKVDVAVEDSFGEWWVEHWGHRECWLFWEGQKGELMQR